MSTCLLPMQLIFTNFTFFQAFPDAAAVSCWIKRKTKEATGGIMSLLLFVVPFRVFHRKLPHTVFLWSLGILILPLNSLTFSWMTSGLMQSIFVNVLAMYLLMAAYYKFPTSKFLDCKIPYYCFLTFWLLQVGYVTTICFSCFLIRCIMVSLCYIKYGLN